MEDSIYLADNLDVLPGLPDGSFQLVYADPPFNTGRAQTRRTLETVADTEGDRTGFKGRRYSTRLLNESSYRDSFDDYLGFLEPRLLELHRLLHPTGTLYLHLDYREAHYVKLLCDEIFGREQFLNEIIWAYDYGARAKRRWPAKHDTILVYVKDAQGYYFDSEAVDREPYMAPGLVTAEKAARGKLPTDCYSDDTEILTSGGWVAFPDLTLDDAVASVTPDQMIVYSRPTKLHCHRYQGPMHWFKSKTIDLLVTPNHKLYVRPKNSAKYSFVAAEDLADSPSTYYSVINQLAWSGFDADEIALPPVDYRNPWSAKPLPVMPVGPWCEFMGFYLSEGSSTSYRDRHEVHITQITQTHRQRIADVLTELGLRFHWNGRSFVVCNKQLTSYLKSFGKAHEKHIPLELLLLAPHHLERLYDGLMAGDGHVDGSEAVYVTVSRGLADGVQELMLKLGHNATITRRTVLNEGWRPQFAVQRRISHESTIWPARHRRILSYDGYVYCCTVEPHHTLIVRRNGRPVVCGNCWWHTIVSPTGKEKTGYPTQKPLGVLRRIVQASSHEGDWCLDPFAGSGTLGAAAAELGRRYVLVDSSPEAVRVMEQRLGVEARAA